MRIHENACYFSIRYMQSLLSRISGGIGPKVLSDTPTTAHPPLPLGELDANGSGLDAKQWTEQIFAYTPFTNLYNTTGQPAISLPLAWSKDSLPIGMMFSARFADEATLFRLARQLEEARP